MSTTRKILRTVGIVLAAPFVIAAFLWMCIVAFGGVIFFGDLPHPWNIVAWAAALVTLVACAAAPYIHDVWSKP